MHIFCVTQKNIFKSKVTMFIQRSYVISIVNSSLKLSWSNSTSEFCSESFWGSFVSPSTFQNRCQQFQNTINRLNREIETLRQQLERAGREGNPEGILQAHTAALQRQAEESRKQYERCLDDVANQVVRALLAQKVSD